jgi:hypothetical protein
VVSLGRLRQPALCNGFVAVKDDLDFDASWPGGLEEGREVLQGC